MWVCLCVGMCLSIENSFLNACVYGPLPSHHRHCTNKEEERKKNEISTKWNNETIDVLNNKRSQSCSHFSISIFFFFFRFHFFFVFIFPHFIQLYSFRFFFFLWYIIGFTSYVSHFELCKGMQTHYCQATIHMLCHCCSPLLLLMMMMVMVMENLLQQQKSLPKWWGNKRKEQSWKKQASELLMISCSTIIMNEMNEQNEK